VVAPDRAVNAARLALDHWGNADATIMIAIAGCESSWRADAAGDNITLIGPTPWQCGGFTSFGIYQVHLPAHHDAIGSLAFSTDPCRMRDYLFGAGRNTSFARVLWDQRRNAGLDPFGPWTCYNTGAYQAHLQTAREAILLAGGDVAGLFPEAVPIDQLPPVRMTAPAVDAFSRIRPVRLA
jgi:hypothetical protein